jgi:hypothetical protein
LRARLGLGPPRHRASCAESRQGRSQGHPTGKERARLAKAQNMNCKDSVKQKQEKQKKAAAT